MAWAWNLCVGFLLVLLWSRLLPLALVLVSCVKLIEFSPVPFFGCSSVSYCCSDSSRVYMAELRMTHMHATEDELQQLRDNGFAAQEAEDRTGEETKRTQIQHAIQRRAKETGSDLTAGTKSNLEMVRWSLNWINRPLTVTPKRIKTRSGSREGIHR
ncbi:hypothetical protein Bca101_092108 [Brassica carinata]